MAAPTKKAVPRRRTPPVKKQPADLPIIRTSERKDFRRCQIRWWWGWRMGLTKPFAAGSLWFGEGYHIALAEWYRNGLDRGPHPAETFAAWVGEERRRIFTTPNPGVDEVEIVNAKDLGVAMLNAYVERYGRDEHMYFMATEQVFQMLIPGLSQGDPFIAIFAGTFDGVYRDLTDDSIWLIEHKTAKAIQTGHLSLDDQAGGYWMAATQVLRHAGLIGPREELSGIRYNFSRKAMPDDRPINADGMRLNKDGTVSKSQPAPYFVREPVLRTRAERQTQIERIRDEARQMDAIRKGDLPITKNPTRDCQWDCPFFNMCELHEAKEAWEDYATAMYVVEDPYADHRTRKSTAE
jgi:hypothetical protein